MTLPIDLVLVRHGESEGNVAMRASRKGDDTHHTPEFLARHSSEWRLTDEGCAQAEAAGAWLRAEFPDGFERHLVSEYVRTIQTAALLDLPGAQWYRSVDLRERDYGAMDVITESERRSRYADEVRRRDTNAFYWRPPGGESIASMQLRLRWPLDGLHREASESGVVVCHGEVMRAKQMLLERLDVAEWHALESSDEDHDRIWNCQIMHYTRRDPDTGQLHPYMVARRSICPWDRSKSSDQWHRIVRRPRSNQELLAEVERRSPR